MAVISLNNSRRGITTANAIIKENRTNRKNFEKERNEAIKDIENVGLNNATNEKDYKNKYNKLKENSKKFVVNPTKFSENYLSSKKKIISENNVKINQKIDYYYNKIKNTNKKEYKKKYNAVIKKLKEGYNKLIDFDSLYNYAKKYGRYIKKKYSYNKNKKDWQNNNPVVYVNPITNEGYSVNPGKEKEYEEKGFVKAYWNYDKKKPEFMSEGIKKANILIDKYNKDLAKDYQETITDTDQWGRKYSKVDFNDEHINQKIKEYEEIKKDYQSTEQYKKEKLIEQRISKEVNKSKWEWQKPIRKLLYGGVEWVKHDAKGIYNMKSAFRWSKDKFNKKEWEEWNKYMELNEKQKVEDWKRDIGISTGYMGNEQFAIIGQTMSRYMHEKDYQKKEYLERQLLEKYNEIMRLQGTPELQEEITPEYKRQFREGTNVAMAMGLGGEGVALIGRTTKNIIRGNKINTILKMPKTVEIKLNANVIRKLKTLGIKKPQITKFLDGSKSLTMKDYLKIEQLVGKDFILSGTIKGKKLEGTIIGYKGKVYTEMYKEVGKLRKKTYIIRTEQTGDDLTTRILTNKGKEIYKDISKNYGRIGAKEGKNIYQDKIVRQSVNEKGAVKDIIEGSKKEYDIIQLNKANKGEYVLKEGKMAETINVKTRKAIQHGEWGKLGEYGKEIEGIRKVKILEGDLNILPNGRIVEEIKFNTELMKKHGKEGIKLKGKYIDSPKGLVKQEVEHIGEIYLPLSKKLTKKEEVMEEIGKYIKRLHRDKRGQIQITRTKVKIPTPKIEIADIGKSLNIRLPKEISYNGLKSLVDKGIITRTAIVNMIKSKRRIKINNKMIIVNKNKLETKQLQRLKQIQKLQQMQKIGSPNMGELVNLEIMPNYIKTPIKPKIPIIPIIPIPKPNKKNKRNYNKIAIKEGENRIDRLNDPYLRITGKRKYSINLLKELRKRYGTTFT